MIDTKFLETINNDLRRDEVPPCAETRRGDHMSVPEARHINRHAVERVRHDIQVVQGVVERHAIPGDRQCS